MRLSVKKKNEEYDIRLSYIALMSWRHETQFNVHYYYFFSFRDWSYTLSNHNSGSQPIMLGIRVLFQHFSDDYCCSKQTRLFCSICTLSCRSIFSIQLFNSLIPFLELQKQLVLLRRSLTSTILEPCFLSPFFFTRVSNRNDGSIIWHLTVFFSTTVTSGLFFSKFFSVCMGKTYKILLSSDLNTFTTLHKIP